MLKKKDPRGDLGKWAEEQARKWLDAQSAARADFAYHRYPDARAARGALATQPCDFLVGLKRITGPVSVHLEVKETAQARRLPRGKISQIGMLLKFHWVGFRTLVLVYRSTFNDWTYFVANDLFGDPDAASFPFVDGRSFPTAEAALNFLFEF